MLTLVYSREQLGDDGDVSVLLRGMLGKGYVIRRMIEAHELDHMPDSQLESGRNAVCLWKPNPALARGLRAVSAGGRR